MDLRRTRWLAAREGHEPPISALGRASTWSGLWFPNAPPLCPRMLGSHFEATSNARGFWGGRGLRIWPLRHSRKVYLSLRWTDILSHCSGLEMGFRNTGSVSGCYGRAWLDGGCKLTETRARERRRKTESCYVDLGQCRGQISCCQKPGCEVREKKRRESAVIVGWVGETSCERPPRGPRRTT